MRDDPNFTALSRSKVFGILCYMGSVEGHKVSISSMHPRFGEWAILRKRTDEMERSGLVKTSVESTPKSTVYLTLTDVGEEVAARMSRIDGMVSPNSPTMEKSVAQQLADPLLRALYDPETGAGRRVLVKDLGRVVTNRRTLDRLTELFVRDGLMVHGREDTAYRPAFLELTPEGVGVAREFYESYVLMTSEDGKVARRRRFRNDLSIWKSWSDAFRWASRSRVSGDGDAAGR